MRRRDEGGPNDARETCDNGTFYGPPIDGTNQRRVTIWFNAWKYDSTSQVWAGLADAIVQQVGERLGPVKRELFWFSLQLGRLDSGKIRRKVYEQVVGQFLERVLPWLWAYITGFAAAIALGVASQIAKSNFWLRHGSWGSMSIVIAEIWTLSIQVKNNQVICQGTACPI